MPDGGLDHAFSAAVPSGRIVFMASFIIITGHQRAVEVAGQVWETPHGMEHGGPAGPSWLSREFASALCSGVPRGCAHAAPQWAPASWAF